MKQYGLLLATISVVMTGALAPAVASANPGRTSRRIEVRRQGSKNEWRDVALGSAAVGLLGLLGHNPAVALAGAAGAIYSGERYEHDRRSSERPRPMAYHRPDRRRGR